MSFDCIWEFECWRGHLSAMWVCHYSIKFGDDNLTQILARYFTQSADSDRRSIGERKSIPFDSSAPTDSARDKLGSYKSHHLPILTFSIFPGFPHTLYSRFTLFLPWRSFLGVGPLGLPQPAEYQSMGSKKVVHSTQYSSRCGLKLQKSHPQPFILGTSKHNLVLFFW